MLRDLTCNETISSSDSDPEHSKDTTGFPIAANSWGSYEDVTDAMLLSVDMGEALQQLIDEKSVTRLKDDVNIKTRNTNTGDNASAEAERSADLMASDSEPFQCAQVPQVFTSGSSDESNTDGDFSQFSTLPFKLEKRIQYERQEEDIGNVGTSAKLHGHSAQQHPRKSFKLGDVHKRMLGWEATDR